MEPIIQPKNCPCCKHELTLVKDQLYCKNTNCSAQSSKALSHFTKTAKIKGLGEASIEKLNISTVEELYSLTEEDITNALGSKIGEKIVNELENSKKLPLEMLLPSFNIPLIGKSASAKLSEVISHIEEFNEDTAKQAGLGPKASSNLSNWIENVYHKKYKDSLPFDFKFSKKQETGNKGVVCITGKLKSFKTKSEAEAALKKNGYIVKTSVTKEVTILVNESGIESAKTEKARISGVTIITNIKELTKE